MSGASSSSRYTASSSFRHDQTPVDAVLMVQLGTPKAAEAPAVRRYLAQFLSDPRVVEIPRLLWLLLDQEDRQVLFPRPVYFHPDTWQKNHLQE
ncbi:MAG: hypothetical protein EBW58_06375 [Betaproteobacteria bacterium]|nr:hypothetical protein [Betaproteobacteria bacterium]